MRVLLTILAGGVLISAAARGDEARAIAALTKQGAEVVRDEKAKGMPAIIVRFGVRGSAKTIDLKPLAELPALEVVDLADTPVRDADLAHLAGLPKLVEVNVAGT